MPASKRQTAGKTARAAIDQDLEGVLRALERAAAAALRLAKQTNTPCYVVRQGRIVNLNASRPRNAKSQ